MKVCTKCGIEKDESEFGKERGRLDGLQVHCKACQREYAELNKDRIREYKAQHRRINAENIKKQRDARRDEALAVARAWRLSNKENVKSYSKEYYEANTEKEKLKSRAQSKVYIENLDTPYLKAILKNQGWPKEAITPELIEVKRIIIKFKRLKNDKKNKSSSSK